MHEVQLTADRLAALGREVPASFCVHAQFEDGAIDLHIDDIRRLLPGRRIAAVANVRGEPSFIKLFFGPQAQRDCAREIDGHRLLRDAGIAVAELIAQGSMAGGGAVVVYTLLRDCAPITAAQLPRAMWTLARMHDAGIVHADLHPDNLLVGTKHVRIVDGGAVTARGAPFTEDGRIRDLANLLAQFALTGAGHIDAVLIAYASAAPRFSTDEWRVRLVATFDVALRTRARRYIDKSMRDCTEFRVARSWRRFVACVRQEYERLELILADPDRLIEHGHVLKDGNTATVVRAQTPQGAVVIKRYNMKSLRHRLSRGLRTSRASHAWQSGHRLRMLGIATADPLLLIEERFGLLRGRAFLVMRSLDGPTLADTDPLPHLDQIVALFGALRRAGLVHTDMKSSNFVLDAGVLCLVDLDAMFEASGVRLRRGHSRDVERFLANWNDAPVLQAQLAAALTTASSAFV